MQKGKFTIECFLTLAIKLKMVLLEKIMQIFRVPFNAVLFGLLWIKQFFFSWSLHWIPTLRRLIVEFLSVGGTVVLIKWALSGRIQAKLLPNLAPLVVIVAIIEIARMVRRAEESYYSLKTYLPLKEAFKKFVNRPIRENLLQRSVQERVDATK